MVNVGNVIAFDYNAKRRIVKVELMATRKQGCFQPIRFVRGWEVTANTPAGAWRSFTPSKMSNFEILA